MSNRLLFTMTILAALLLGSCTRLLGWGVLLWSAEDPAIPAGTVLPVYIKSNINRVWVAGIPQQFRRPGNGGGGMDKFEIPLAQLELFSAKKAAESRAAAFAPLALTYAETLQDGLPIREEPDNGSKRIYRLRQGQIIKILARIEGSQAISTTGEPLAGDWYRVLTEDGSVGCCFSYRLRLFEHSGGPLDARIAGAGAGLEEKEDPELERILAKTWSPEFYGAMIASGRVDMEEMAKHWRFSPGQDAGLARIYTPEVDKTFPYTGIKSDGQRSWRFEASGMASSLGMTLQGDSALAVHYQDDNGLRKTVNFVALSAAVDDIIVQETARRDALFQTICQAGPVFTSANYGVLTLSEDGRFSWSGYDLLVPRIIPQTALGGGFAAMDLFLGPGIEGRYDGAWTFRFDRIGGGPPVAIHFMYTLDDRGLRIEHLPPENLEGVTALYRAASPTVIYFYRGQGF